MDRRAFHTGQSCRRSGRQGLVALLIVALVATIGLSPAATAQEAKPALAGAEPALLAQPSARDRVVATLIARLMPDNHVSRGKLNDTISKRALNLFIDSLDPLKLYFYESDIAEFKESATKIDDMVRNGDLKFAYDIFRRFTERVDQRVEVALELLEGEFDFSRDEEIITDPEAAQYAKDASRCQ